MTGKVKYFSTSWFKRKSKLAEIFLGIILPSIFLFIGAVTSIAANGGSFWEILSSFFIPFLLPIMPLFYLGQNPMLLITIPILILLTILGAKYIEGPFLRYVIALIYSAWLYLSVISEAQIY